METQGLESYLIFSGVFCFAEPKRGSILRLLLRYSIAHQEQEEIPVNWTPPVAGVKGYPIPYSPNGLRPPVSAVAPHAPLYSPTHLRIALT